MIEYLSATQHVSFGSPAFFGEHGRTIVLALNQGREFEALKFSQKLGNTFRAPSGGRV